MPESSSVHTTLLSASVSPRQLCSFPSGSEPSSRRRLFRKPWQCAADHGVIHTCQVINGIAAIVAIQGAGLGVSQAIWSALGVLVAFGWGSLVFSEPVGDLPLAVTGACSDPKLSCGTAGRQLVYSDCACHWSGSGSGSGSPRLPIERPYTCTIPLVSCFVSWFASMTPP